ncbi:MAG: winged helix-turn-helix transcriptional regulator [Acidimicrobiales bacterium]
MHGSSSALDAALRRVGDRWTLLVVAALLEGPRRFGELQEAVPDVATNILSSRLRRLEHHGLVVSRPYSERPLRLEYQLSGGAAELAGVLRLLSTWAGAVDEAHPPAHWACGTPLEVRYFCPTCQVVVLGGVGADAVGADAGSEETVWASEETVWA